VKRKSSPLWPHRGGQDISQALKYFAKPMEDQVGFFPVMEVIAGNFKFFFFPQNAKVSMESRISQETTQLHLQ